MLKETFTEVQELYYGNVIFKEILFCDFQKIKEHGLVN